jgi:hypothetical protein
VTYGDSPLVRACREGRVLMVDEADKAPREVVCILKVIPRSQRIFSVFCRHHLVSFRSKQNR